MKTFKTALILVLFNCSFVLFSQEMGSGEYKFNETNEACLTKNQRKSIIEELKISEANLKSQNKLITVNKQIPNPLFIWPVQVASTTSYHELWAISNYVDHNTAYPNQVTDYTGGSRSYDTSNGYNHQGLDIFTWPYSWKMVDDSGHEIIAASAGQIIYKSDGQYDRSCAFNNNLWNAVYVLHNDGSVAWYGHLKNGSLTTKNVGDMVAQGEYLGVIGSSGNSSGPHLHFEVYEDNTYAYDKLIDPYSGSSNNWNSTSWWAVQKPYRNPTINAITTNEDHPNFGNCPDTEIPNEKNTFLPGELVYFYVFLKDQLGESFNLKTYKPDNSLYNSWTSNTITDDYYSSWWWWSSNVDSTLGQWRLECTLSTGQVLNHYFVVDDGLAVDEYSIDNTVIYPNPVNDDLFINSKTRINKIVLRDALGKLIFEDNDSFTGVKNLNTKFISNGLYFLTIKDEKSQVRVIKFIKK